jgi:hypothetical protein
MVASISATANISTATDTVVAAVATTTTTTNNNNKIKNHPKTDHEGPLTESLCIALLLL